MPSSTRLLLPLYLLACLLALLGLGGLWYGLGKPVQLPDAASPTHKLQCASYTPFDKDQSPYDQPFRLRPARMDADLALLAERFQCIRTYSQTGLEAIPALARKHGLKVMLGAWVNAHPADTEKEIELLIAAANANPDVVSAVIVGNETLLRKEVTGAHLATLIARVKSQVKVPVTYADVWEFWLQHPQVAPAVDFLTIHLLPYWEDDPRGIDEALAHVADVRQVFGTRFAPKDILIGETGWPSEGRQRETATPSRVNEARFIRGFVTLAEHNGWRYNLIAAIAGGVWCRLPGALGRADAHPCTLCRRVAVGAAAGGFEPAGTGPCRTGPGAAHGLARAAVRLAAGAGRLAVAGGGLCRGSEHVGDGVRPTLSQLPQRSTGVAGAGVRTVAGAGATGGGGAAGVHRRCRGGAAVVCGGFGEPTGLGVGSSQCADDRGLVAELAPATGLISLGPLRAPSQASQLPQGRRRFHRQHNSCGSWLACDGPQSGPFQPYSGDLTNRNPASTSANTAMLAV